MSICTLRKKQLRTLVKATIKYSAFKPRLTKDVQLFGLALLKEVETLVFMLKNKQYTQT